MFLKAINVFLYHRSHWKCACQQEKCSCRFYHFTDFRNSQFCNILSNCIYTEKPTYTWNLVSFRFCFFFKIFNLFFHSFHFFLNIFVSINGKVVCVFFFSFFKRFLFLSGARFFLWFSVFRGEFFVSLQLVFKEILLCNLVLPMHSLGD